MQNEEIVIVSLSSDYYLEFGVYRSILALRMHFVRAMPLG
jgi:hypothetical protein